ncbi:MAG: acyl-CoA desaturase [Deltaproteobacteria bacterium]|nr:acyl-CoA desaturase [Deltaproteobacteria bacterium]
MYLKTAIMLAWLAASYWLLLFVVATPIQAVLCAVALGLAMAGVGFNIQHDGGHGAYSDRPWVNKTMALSLDLLGGTAYFWHYKHNVAHHTHPNVQGHDDDINLGVLGRVSPHQKWYPAHRFQHIYLWVVYSLLALEWQTTGEFRNLISKRHIGSTRVPFPRGSEHFIFWAGKLVFFGLAFALPLTLHSVSHVLAVYVIAAATLGLVLASVFQLAHCSDQAQFRMPGVGATSVERPWAEHQVETAVDFGRSSKILCWYLGGLNFQVVHHLFPKICHIHYPALAPIVEATCRAHGVRYYAFDSAWDALRSHVRWLRVMGQPSAQTIEQDQGKVAATG